MSATERAWTRVCDARQHACHVADMLLDGLAERAELRAALDAIEVARDAWHAAFNDEQTRRCA